MGDQMKKRIILKILTVMILISGVILLVKPIYASGKVQLVSPSDKSKLDSIPTLQWGSVAWAKGYNWEISTSSKIDDTGYYFVDSICSGSTIATHVNIHCTLQENTWYYWHVWVSKDGQPCPPSDVWRFKLTGLNHHPIIVSARVSPGSGDTDDTYRFEATYEDEDNDPPTMIKVYIDGVPYDMAAIDSDDNDYTDGKEYKYETKLSEGAHDYCFYCEDGKGGSDRSPDSGTLYGPIVSPVQPSPSVTIRKFTVSPLSVELGDEIGYTYEIVGDGQPGTVKIDIYSPTDQNVYSFSEDCDSIGVITRSAVLWQVPADAEAGTYAVIVNVLFEGDVIATKQVSFEVITCTLPSAPQLISPANGATDLAVRTNFGWGSVSGATSYRIQISVGSSFSSNLIDQEVNSTSFTPSTVLAEYTTYYWRVRAENECGHSSWSSIWNFTTVSPETPYTPEPTSTKTPEPTSPLTPTPSDEWSIEKIGAICSIVGIPLAILIFLYQERIKERLLGKKKARGRQEELSSEETFEEKVVGEKPPGADYKHDIAISFAGEDREIAKNLAEKLQNKLVNDRAVKVFYDEFYKSELWGKEQTEYFQKAYGPDSRFVVLLLSRHYPVKKWTGFEFSIMREEAE
jgi:hypothetical protein